MNTNVPIPSWECVGDSGENMNRRFLLIRVEVDGFGFTHKTPYDLFLPEHEAQLRVYLEKKYAEALDLLGYIVGDSHVLH